MGNKIDQFVIDRVREIRLKKGISQAELGAQIGLSRGFIGDIENPNHRAKNNLNHLNKIAIAFNCSIRDFFPEKYLEED